MTWVTFIATESALVVICHVINHHHVINHLLFLLGDGASLIFVAGEQHKRSQ